MDANEKIQQFLSQFDALNNNLAIEENFLLSKVKYVLEKNHIKVSKYESRIKERESLEKKLHDNQYFLEEESVKAVKDLIGIRIILFDNNDIYTVRTLIQENFMVENIKIKDNFESYNAVHLILKINNDPETFAEIQLTTVMYYAWSQISHRIVYKPRLEKDTQSLNALTESFNDIMREHIKPAQIAFDYLINKESEIFDGQSIINGSYLRNLQNEQNVETLTCAFKKIKNVIQENGKFTELKPEFMFGLKSIIEKFDCVSDEKAYSELYQEYLEVVNISKYAYIDITSEILLNSIYFHKNQIISKKALEILEEFLEYQYLVLKRYNYFIQENFIKFFLNIEQDLLLERKYYTKKIFAKILSMDFSGSEHDSVDQVSFFNGYLTPNKSLKYIRSSCFEALEALYFISDLETKEGLVDLYCQSTLLNYNKQEISNELKESIDADQLRFLNFIHSNFSKASLLEQHTMLACCKNLRMRSNNEDVIKMSKELIKSLSSNEKLITIYELTLNHNNYFQQESRDHDFEEFCEHTCNKYLDQVSVQSYDYWLETISLITKNYKDSYAPILSALCSRLTTKLPKLTLKLLELPEDEISLVSGNLIFGLISNLPESQFNKKSILNSFIKEKKFLLDISRLSSKIYNIDKSLFYSLWALISNTENKVFVVRFFEQVAFASDSLDKEDLLKILFDYINIFKGTENFKVDCTLRILFEKVFDIMSISQLETIKTLIIEQSNFDYACEKILITIANDDLKSAIEVLLDRIDFDKHSASQHGKFYEVVPYVVYDANKEFTKLGSNEDILSHFFSRIANYDKHQMRDLFSMLLKFMPDIDNVMNSKEFDFIKSELDPEIFLAWLYAKSFDESMIPTALNFLACKGEEDKYLERFYNSICHNGFTMELEEKLISRKVNLKNMFEAWSNEENLKIKEASKKLYQWATLDLDSSVAINRTFDKKREMEFNLYRK